MGIFRRKKNDQSGGTGPATESVADKAPTSYVPLREFAWNHVAAQQSAHEGLWSMSTAERFDCDLAGSAITWFNTAKGMTVSAPCQLLGTWNPTDSSLLWAWDHPSAPPGTAVAAQAVKAFADANQIAELQSATIGCSRDEAYEITAIASPLGDLQGIYRFESAPGAAWVYIGFGNVTMSKG